MKTLAIILIASSFLAGAFLSVLDPLKVNWALFVPVLLVGAAGLVMHLRARHKLASSDVMLSGNMGTLETSLRRIVANLETLQARGADLPTYEARFEIDRLFRHDLNAFAEARESMVHVFGMQNYADVMSNFAAGERYINRVWSASTDGYVDEVTTYLDKATLQFREAERHFIEVRDRVASGAGNQPSG